MVARILALILFAATASAQTVFVTTNNYNTLNPEADALSGPAGSFRITHTITDGSSPLSFEFLESPINLRVVDRKDSFTNYVRSAFVTNNPGTVRWTITNLTEGSYSLYSEITLGGDTFPVFWRYLTVTSAAAPVVSVSVTNQSTVSVTVTNILDPVEYDPVWVSASTGYLKKTEGATTYVSSVTGTSSVNGALTFTGSGVTQTGSVFNFSGGSAGFVSPATNTLEMQMYPVRFSQTIFVSPGNASIELSVTNVDPNGVGDPYPRLRVSGGGYGGTWGDQFFDLGFGSPSLYPSNGYVLTYTATDSTWRAKAASGGGGDLSALSNGLVNVGLAASNAYPRGGTSGLNWSAISNAPANITTQGTITAASIGAVPNTMTTNTVPLFWNSSVPATTNDFIGFTYGSTLTTRSGGTNYSFAAFVNAATNVYTATASADFSWPLLPTTVTSIELHHACISSGNAKLVYEFANTDCGWSYITTQTVANTGLNITTNLTITGTALTNAAPGQLWSVKVTGSGGCTNTANPAFFGPRTIFKVIGQ